MGHALLASHFGPWKVSCNFSMCTIHQRRPGIRFRPTHQIDSFLCSGPELVACSLDISIYQMPFENYFSIYSPFTGRAAERMKCFVEPIFDRFVLVLFVADLEAEERTYYSSLHLLMEMLRRPNPK